MTRMTVSIDDGLLANAQEALGARTKIETIRMALKEAVRQRRLKQALENRNRIELSLDANQLERLRQEG